MIEGHVFIRSSHIRIYIPTQNGTIKLYKELKCPLDDFELLLFSLGR